MSVDTPSKSYIDVVAQWAILTVASVAAAAVLEFMAVPAALMIGPMLAAICAGALGVKLQLWPKLTALSFAIIGVMIAAAIEPALFSALLDNWLVVLAATLSTLAASTLLGLLISRWGILPGTTAIWGSAPGAASAMVMMADAFGADARLVAFMQYVRVVMVSLAAAFIARFFVDTSGVETDPVIWFPSIIPAAFGVTMLVAAAGYALGRVARLPSPAFMGPLILGVIVHAGAGAHFQLPEWLLALSFLVLGWSIGLRFDRNMLIYSFKRLPHIIVFVLVLIGFCGAIAWALAHYLGIDPLTAYLATSPGGMDTVAIIAAASDSVDIAFVMTMQTMRFIIVLLFGPPFSRWLAGRMAASG
jgi:membrane AbrB-like protein